MADLPEERKYFNDFGEVKVLKTNIRISNKKKKVYISKSMIQLEDYKEEYGTVHKEYSEEEIKRRHLGKVKCSIKFKSEDELKNVLTHYFA